MGLYIAFSVFTIVDFLLYGQFLLRRLWIELWLIAAHPMNMAF